MIKKIIIAAISSNGYIGKDGKMPWHSKEEFKHFKETTAGNALVMGRTTFISIGKPLKNRLNIILTNNKENEIIHPDVVMASSLDEAYQIAEDRGYRTIFVCGGASVYEESLNYADELILSYMKLKVDGDVKFPEFDKDLWGKTENRCFNEFEVINYKRL